jgi:uncharacterized protein YjiS (DUF1127 family)
MKHHFVTTPGAANALPAYRATSVLNRAKAALTWLDAAWAAHRRHVREIRYLEAMDDRDLRVLGLTRVDVRAIVAGHYREH